MASIAAERSRADGHRFYVAMSAAFVVIAFGGFIPTYWAKLAVGSFGGAPILHLHGALFFGWTLFYFFQTSLVAAGRTLDHRQWGLAGISLATAMGFTVVLAVLNSVHVADRLGMGDAARRFASVSLIGLLVFAAFFGTAIARARDKALHKRLMILAMIPLMHAATARVFATLLAPPGGGGGPPPVLMSVPPGLTVDLLIVAAMIHDWRSIGRVHPAYRVGLPILVAVQVGVIPLSATTAWLSIVRALEAFGG